MNYNKTWVCRGCGQVLEVAPDTSDDWLTMVTCSECLTKSWELLDGDVAVQHESDDIGVTLDEALEGGAVTMTREQVDD